MAVFTAIWTFVKGLFVSNGLGGVLLKQLGMHAGCEAVKLLKNDDIGTKAIAFVKELHNRTDINGVQKAAEFNKRLGAYCLKVGLTVSTSTLNLMREMAYQIVTAQLRKEEQKKLN